MEPLHLRRGVKSMMPAIMTSRWRAPDGREAQVFANWTDRPQKGRLILERVRRFTLTSSARPDVVTGKANAVALSLPPFSVAMLEYQP